MLNIADNMQNIYSSSFEQVEILCGTSHLDEVPESDIVLCNLLSLFFFSVLVERCWIMIVNIFRCLFCVCCGLLMLLWYVPRSRNSSLVTCLGGCLPLPDCLVGKFFSVVTCLVLRNYLLVNRLVLIILGELISRGLSFDELSG